MKGRGGTLRLLAPVLAVANLACGVSGGALSVPLAVHVVGDDGTLVPGATIQVGGQPLGKSDVSGTVRARLEGGEGTVFFASAICPAPFDEAEQQERIVLSEVAPLFSSDGSLSVRFSCRRHTRRAGIVVRARARMRTTSVEDAHKLAAGQDLLTPLSGVPILRGREVVGRTNRDGIAHVVLDASPRSVVDLALDTSRGPLADLRPRSPSLSVTMAERDDVYVFDQTFVDEVTPPAPRKRRRVPRHEIRVYRDGIKAPMMEFTPR
jgi:hypothetical protein